MFQPILMVFLLMFSLFAKAQHMGHATSPDPETASVTPLMGPEACGQMMVWDRMTMSCIVVPREDMSMGMWMIHGNAFLVQNFDEGERARNRLALPNMIMADVGQTFGKHYLGVNLMLTAEKWTFPKEGYPLLLQIGEMNEEEEPYIDAQHPHSSPIMGLTFSDTIALDESGDYMRLFFAPRGQATEGPIPFMHRPTGMVNPSAPLGHHIGQDVSHITSTVLGASLNKEPFGVEISTFNGTEPEPTHVDLPLGPLNSYAARLSYEFSEESFAMISAAQLKEPEPHDPEIEKLWRYSASLITKNQLPSDWNFHNTVIYGHVNFYDNVPVLRSLLEEFWLHQKDSPHQYWGRIEFVERTAAELGILDASTPMTPRWVSAFTAGYTYQFQANSQHSLQTGMGGSITKNFLPDEFEASYSGDPLSARIFLQVTGMKMGSF